MQACCIAVPGSQGIDSDPRSTGRLWPASLSAFHAHDARRHRGAGCQGSACGSIPVCVPF